MNLSRSKEFLLRTSFIPSKKDKILDDIRKDEEIQYELRWPYKSKRAKVPSTGPVVFSPVNQEHRTTLAAALKAQAAKQMIQHREQQQQTQESQEKKRATNHKVGEA